MANTCFFNASIQLLLSIKPLVSVLQEFIRKPKKEQQQFFPLSVQTHIVYDFLPLIHAYADNHYTSFDAQKNGILETLTNRAYETFFKKEAVSSLSRTQKDQLLHDFDMRQNTYLSIMQDHPERTDEMLSHLEVLEAEKKSFLDAHQIIYDTQEDASEFLIQFLSVLSVYDPLKNLYTSTIASEINCAPERNVPLYYSKTVDPYTMLTMPICTLDNDGKSIKRTFNHFNQVLEEYFKKEHVQGIVDVWHNRRSPCTKQLLIEKPSPYLFISLNRVIMLQGGMHKLNHAVEMPIDLILDAYTVHKIPVSYTLIAAAVQSGSALGGHYIAYVKRDDGWYKCNDAIITYLGPTLSQEALADIYGGYGSTSGYCFVYEQKKVLAPAKRSIPLPSTSVNITAALNGLTGAIKNLTLSLSKK